MSSATVVAIVVESVQVVEEQVELRLDELCHSCSAARALVLELVAHGLLEPSGSDPDDWRFAGTSLAVTRRAQRLIDELGVNVAGAAVAIELLARIDQLSSLQRR
jgi:chaperone modulatory protein CbpM